LERGRGGGFYHISTKHLTPLSPWRGGRGGDYPKGSREGGKPWNGKIYGRPGSYNYYVDDTKHSMTDEQKAAIDEYRAALQAWREQ